MSPHDECQHPAGGEQLPEFWRLRGGEVVRGALSWALEDEGGGRRMEGMKVGRSREGQSGQCGVMQRTGRQSHCRGLGGRWPGHAGISLSTLLISCG
jgi:hypothetical protein